MLFGQLYEINMIWDTLDPINERSPSISSCINDESKRQIYPAANIVLITNTASSRYIHKYVHKSKGKHFQRYFHPNISQLLHTLACLIQLLTNTLLTVEYMTQLHLYSHSHVWWHAEPSDEVMLYWVEPLSWARALIFNQNLSQNLTPITWAASSAV